MRGFYGRNSVTRTTEPEIDPDEIVVDPDKTSLTRD